MLTQSQIEAATRHAGLSGRPLCVHSSFRSFGGVAGGPATVIAALLAEGCSVMTPTFSYELAVAAPPHSRPPRNGIRYDEAGPPPGPEHPLFSPESDELTLEAMGAIPAALLAMPGRLRGNHPLNSFSAIGPLAAALIGGQQPLDVYAPFRALIDHDGIVVMMGVGLISMTIIHFAEQQAGRTLFRGWALGPDRQVIDVQVGSCSDGFHRLDPILAPSERVVEVGPSRWRCFPARELVARAAQAIRDDPGLTHCADAACERCNDAQQGGPIL